MYVSRLRVPPRAKVAKICPTCGSPATITSTIHVALVERPVVSSQS